MTPIIFLLQRALGFTANTESEIQTFYPSAAPYPSTAAPKEPLEEGRPLCIREVRSFPCVLSAFGPPAPIAWAGGRCFPGELELAGPMGLGLELYLCPNSGFAQDGGGNFSHVLQTSPFCLCLLLSPELKSLLIKVKQESEQAGLKLNIQKTKIVASGPITSQQIDGGKNGNSDRLHFLHFHLTVDGDFSHEMKKDACSLEEKQRIGPT